MQRSIIYNNFRPVCSLNLQGVQKTTLQRLHLLAFFYRFRNSKRTCDQQSHVRKRDHLVEIIRHMWTRASCALMYWSRKSFSQRHRLKVDRKSPKFTKNNSNGASVIVAEMYLRGGNRRNSTPVGLALFGIWKKDKVKGGIF